jgi:dipeptidyl aminopeptidase/acylaminoacyl peptidase
MQARTVTQRLDSMPFWLAVLFPAALLLLLVVALVLNIPSTSSGAATSNGPRIAYFEFGFRADTLWLADPFNPEQRESVLSVPHAPEFGVVPTVSPDGRLLAFTALAPGTRAPSAAAPAGLWLAELAGSRQPRLLASGVDLQVKPVWSSTGDGVVYRRTTADGYVLALLPIDGANERVLAKSSEALLPVAAKDGRVYYVALGDGGSTFHSVDLTNGSVSAPLQLFDGLTRDWTLSPDARRLAFLALSLGPVAVSSQALVLDLATGAIAPLSDASVDAFGPVWTESGRLVVGSLDRHSGAGSLILEGQTEPAVAAPQRGFDLPLRAVPSGGYIVRSFTGGSLAQPGNSTVVFIGADGARRVIASGEVTFAGWRP